MSGEFVACGISSRPPVLGFAARFAAQGFCFSLPFPFSLPAFSPSLSWRVTAASTRLPGAHHPDADHTAMFQGSSQWACWGYHSLSWGSSSERASAFGVLAKSSAALLAPTTFSHIRGPGRHPLQFDFCFLSQWCSATPVTCFREEPDSGSDSRGAPSSITMHWPKLRWLRGPGALAPVPSALSPFCISTPQGCLFLSVLRSV